jgi:(p)ppGpp synthase/HD superfamily hydrolase
MNERSQVLGLRFQEALQFAIAVHARQNRKGTRIPYAAHLLAVCALVLSDGGDEDEAIAALLHDALEDHPKTVSPDEIDRRFGPRVLRLVQACTDTPPDYTGGAKPPWGDRKRAYLRHIRQAGPQGTRVALADKVDNARAIVTDYRELGDALWSRFSSGKDEQLWYYRELVEAFQEAGARGRMLDELRRLVDELERLVADASV